MKKIVSFFIQSMSICGYCRDWTDICQPWGWRWKPVFLAMSCCHSRCFQQSNMSQNVVYSKTICSLRRNWSFLCSVISKGKVVALDRWGGKWNQLSMTHRLTTNYAKNYCNRTLIVKVIVENVVTCFFGTRCRYTLQRKKWKGLCVTTQIIMLQWQSNG